MQKIDQENLSEFTNELSAFQAEASKVAYFDAYDQFTISKLEGHVVDLCQLSTDASHAGLQYLCEHLRDNIHDHSITGTNISNDEFALMTEWETLVKAYLVNNENAGVVSALATNLSKNAWKYPLSLQETGNAVSVLLGKSSSSQQNIQSSNGELSADDDLPNKKVDMSALELEEIDETVFNSIVDELYVADEGVGDSEYGKEIDKGLSITEAVLTHNEGSLIDKIHVSEQELNGVNQAVSSSIVDELFVAGDSEYDEESDKKLSATEDTQVNQSDASIEKVTVSEQVLDQIDQAVPNSIADELFIADDRIEEFEHGEEFDNELSSVEAITGESLGNGSQLPMQDYSEAIQMTADDVNELSHNPEFNNNLSSPSSFEDSQQEMVVAIADELYANEQDNIDDGITVDSETTQPRLVVESEPETVCLESVQKKPTAPESIIKAYVDVVADKTYRNKPKELEQELIDKPSKPAVIQTLEPIESILLKYPDWSEEQKELLSLILSEVHDVIDQQDEILAVLHENKVIEQDVLDMVSLYSEQIGRMGSAAEMVGLHALQKLCELIGFHFGDLERSSIEMIVSSEERVREWPFIVYEYLKNIHNEKSHQEAINYISNDAWIRIICEDIKKDLKEAFSHSTIYIEKKDEDQRITTASLVSVDITVPGDVQAELLDGLLQELPHQTEEFSEAIQRLIQDDYLNQLEVTQRIAHTIKGAANTVGIVGVATLTHHLEDILQALLKAKAKPSDNLQVALIEASDCLEQMTEYLLGQGDQPSDGVQVLQVILDWANYIDEFGVPNDGAGQTLPAVNDEQSKTQGKTDDNAKNAKAKSSQDISLRVSANLIDELINQSGESIIATSQMHENVNKLLISMRDIKQNKDNVYSLSQQLEHLINVQGVNNRFSSDHDNEKFDPLEFDQYNELHTYSRRLIETTADSVELIKDMEERLFSLESVIADQAKAQKDNQYAILKTRMIPVESMVARLKRGVHQSAKISGKSVELEVLGVDIVLDSKILNNLIDPLMHLLRNAVDHGIESDDLRKANGKSLPGIIELSFVQVGERLEINCKDDGKGLDAEMIKARAIEKGMILNDQQLDDEEIHQIIMQHGFSTCDEVTQISGRGVGMDVVFSNIKILNGSIVISSELNKGMNVELSLPVSLLTAHALLIPTISGSMAVSASGIEEILQVNMDKRPLHKA